MEAFKILLEMNKIIVAIRNSTLHKPSKRKFLQVGLRKLLIFLLKIENSEIAENPFLGSKSSFPL